MPNRLRALFVPAIAAICATHVAAASAQVSATEGFVHVGGDVRLYYRMVGSGADTVVVLHGGPGFSMEYFAVDLEPLAARHTLLFYDQRGAGRSTLASDSVALDAQRFAEDLEAVRKHFRLERLTLVGHSWGAAVAALYGARYPARIGRLILVGPLPITRAQFAPVFGRMDARRDSVMRRRLLELRQARTAHPGDAAICRAYYSVWYPPMFADPRALSRSRGDFCAGTPEALTNKVKSVDRYTMASLGEWDWRAAMSRVEAQTLVMHGTMDAIPPESGREWVAAMPNARFLFLANSGHFPYLEIPDPFFAAIETFLHGKWPGGATQVQRP